MVVENPLRPPVAGAEGKGCINVPRITWRVLCHWNVYPNDRHLRINKHLPSYSRLSPSTRLCGQSKQRLLANKEFLRTKPIDGYTHNRPVTGGAPGLDAYFPKVPLPGRQSNHKREVQKLYRDKVFPTFWTSWFWFDFEYYHRVLYNVLSRKLLFFNNDSVTVPTRFGYSRHNLEG